ncbi:Bax inhibitor-1/YccA family protein [Streptomyces sp. NPDC058440]|uniref:Bax inhibitor-1/YccA family membrane protein n=1 Tax=Streptomyces sp. NPDC058440 TaxID=3346501 RepID=UPI00365F335D
MPPVERPVLQSSNPVLSSRGFRRQNGGKTTARGPVVRAAWVGTHIRAGCDGHGSGELQRFPLPYLVADLMTKSNVLARASLAFGMTAVGVVLSWTVPQVPPTSLGRSYGIAVCAGLVVAVLVSLQRRMSSPAPALTLAHAVAQGVFLGMLSESVSAHISSGLFVQFVLGTMAAFAGVLVVHAVRLTSVAHRWYGFICAALLGSLLLITADLMLCPVLGTRGLGFHSMLVGVLVGVAGIVLAVSFLALHLGQVQAGITHGVPRRESWAAAFGLNLTLVWLYVETARLIISLARRTSGVSPRTVIRRQGHRRNDGTTSYTRIHEISHTRAVSRYVMGTAAAVVLVAVTVVAVWNSHPSNDGRDHHRVSAVIEEGAVCQSFPDQRYEVSCSTTAFGDVRFNCTNGRLGMCPPTTAVTLRNVGRIPVTLTMVSGNGEGDQRVTSLPDLTPGRAVTLRPRDEAYLSDILVRSAKPGWGAVKVVAVE